MTSHWMTLQEAFEAAKESAVECTEQKFQQQLQRGEIESKASHLECTESRSQRRGNLTIVKSRIKPTILRYRAPLEVGFRRRATIDFVSSTATSVAAVGSSEAREILVSRADIERLWPSLPPEKGSGEVSPRRQAAGQESGTGMVPLLRWGASRSMRDARRRRPRWAN